MAKALYRKYRPTSLEDVVGQDELIKTLSSAIKNGTISHAYLFIGPRGCGKTSVARIFAHAINGFDYQLEDNYIDIIEIDAASNTGIDNIRELREKAIIAPTTGKYKVYIIDEVHMLSKSAFNGLLKILEEPPEHVVFIMATTDPEKIPITITSRTQTYTFHLASPETLKTHLRKISDQEKINITDEALAIIADRGAGSFRDSISLLDQIATIKDQKITSDVVEKVFGLPKAAELKALLAAYETSDQKELTAILKSLLSAGTKPETVAADLIAAILKNPKPTLLPLLKTLPEVVAPFPEAKLTLALLSPFSQSPRLSPISQPPHPSPLPQPEHPLPSPQPTAQPPQSIGNTKAIWQPLLDALSQKSPTLEKQLLKCTHQESPTALDLYPPNNFTKRIIESPKNRELLATLLPGIALVVHDQDEQTTVEKSESNLQSPSPTDQISAIMGKVQEVNNGGESTPF